MRNNLNKNAFYLFILRDSNNISEKKEKLK